MTLLSAFILLFLVMDPFGNAPVFMCVLRDVPAERKRKVILRELLIALLVLAVCLWVGPTLLRAMQISEPSLRIAGGVILFIIALKMIFSPPDNMVTGSPDGEPLIVPLAIPLLAGPSAIATVLLLRGQEPQRWPEWGAALLLAWLLTSAILLLSPNLERILKKRGMAALQHLMGLILTAIAVEMFIKAIHTVFGHQG